MIDSLVELLNGYDTWWFLVLPGFLIIGGAVLTSTVSPYFVLMQIVGAALLIACIGVVVSTTPDASSLDKYLPLILTVSLLVGVIWGLHKAKKQGVEQ